MVIAFDVKFNVEHSYKFYLVGRLEKIQIKDNHTSKSFDWTNSHVPVAAFLK
jgi:hypothetical protein